MRLRHAAMAVATVAFLTSGFTSMALAEDPAPTPPKTIPKDDVKEVVKHFDTWNTRCMEDQTTKALSACHAFVDVRLDEGKRQLLYVGVGYVPNKPDELFLFATTPLGTALAPGIEINVDEKLKMKGAYAFCLPVGCQAEVKLTDDQIKNLKNGSKMEVLFRLLGQGLAKVPIELKGFTAAVNSLPKPKPKS
jgi:invasion protein IalB